ncbi:unnamed protein product [Effrenium voratum]|nr:unnamed protein product [Effrenium voratum]
MASPAATPYRLAANHVHFGCVRARAFEVPFVRFANWPVTSMTFLAAMVARTAGGQRGRAARHASERGERSREYEERGRERNDRGRKGKKQVYSPFCTSMTQWRGQTGRGKKGHFHLLDRYIRRIDALLPEDMEDLVRPLSYKPNQEKTTRTIKITFPDDFVEPDAFSEEDVREFLAPLVPKSIALGWKGEAGAEVFVFFDDNEACRSGRQLDGHRLAGRYAQVRFSVDNKFRRVMEDLGNWKKGGNYLDQDAADSSEGEAVLADA